MNVLEAINKQLNFEWESAFIYKQMAAYMNSQDMPGMTRFFEEQAKEELEHAEKIKEFLQTAGFTVHYEPINPGKQDFKSILDVFKKAYEHEKIVTKNVHDLVNQARKEKDLRPEAMLQWFVQEQLEEESSFLSLITRLERIDGNWGGMYILDKELASR